MATLTDEQRRFLLHHRVPLSAVFDATGLSPRCYRAAMKAADALVAIGVARCRASEHAMRTRAGHCVQCNPAGLGFLRRHTAPGSVYVAYSEREQIAKVGSSQYPNVRIEELNRKAYGGASDWYLYKSFATAEAGRTEALAQWRLRDHWVRRTYFWAGQFRECYELFECAAHVANEAVLTALIEAGEK